MSKVVGAAARAAAAVVLLAGAPTHAMDEARVAKVGAEAPLHRETPHPVPLVSSGETAWTDVFTWPKASYIAIHFSSFDLAPGERVVVQSKGGLTAYTFVGEGKPGLGGSFWATHIPGDTAEVRYFGNGSRPGFGYVVDRIAHGFTAAAPAASADTTAPAVVAPVCASPSSISSICGEDDSHWARCYQTSEPEIYDRSRAIGRLLVNGTSACTAWLVGCEGHILTNNHCIETPADAMNTDYEFMAEGAACAADCSQFGSCPGTVVASTATLVATDIVRDYSLVQLPVNVSGTYGYFKVRPAGPTVGERIYIPGHPAGWGKRFAVASTDPEDSGGLCQVGSLSAPSCVGGGPPEVGYQCDTQGGSSGSPVVAYADQRVVALHHCGSCPNRAVSIGDVIAGLGASLPQCAVNQFMGTIEILQDVASCSSTLNLRVRDDHLVGAVDQSVTLASSLETASESVTLTETPSGSGTFLGTFPTTAAAPVHGDGMLSVANGGSITATYIDADDGQGGSTMPRTDTAAVDCTLPVISSAQATMVTGTSAVIVWSTNEPADSVVSYGSAPPPGETAGDGSRVLSHAVLVEGLEPCTLHYFSVSSRDIAGNQATASNGGAYYTFTTGQDTALVSSDTPRPVPDDDATGATSTIFATVGGTVRDVDVKVNVSHTYDEDLVLTLTSPSGATVLLSNRRGFGGDDYTGTHFDDEAPAPITSAAPPFTGSFRPETPLSAADGIDAAGAWRLKVADLAAVDTGTILGWTLRLATPLRSCGPHASVRASALVSDTCAAGGGGHANGVAEAGERVRIGVTIDNDGPVALTGISGTLTPTTPGVAMIDAEAAWGDLVPGAAGTSLSPHFTAQLPATLACGTSVGYRLTLSAAQGSFIGTFSMDVGLLVPGGGTALSESFAAGIPVSWAVVDGGSGGEPAATWTTGNPGQRTFAAPLAPPVAIVDSDSAGTSASQDEQLVTPLLDLSGAAAVELDYDEFFRWWSGGLNEKGDVDVRSSLTGGSWVNVARNQGVSNPAGATKAGAAHRAVDISAQAAGAANVQVRFHYYDAAFEWWWEIDNVVVLWTEPGSCTMTMCGPPLPPPPVPDGTFGAPMTASRADASGTSIQVGWDVARCPAPGYHLVYGPLAGVSSYALTGGICGLGAAGTTLWSGVPGGSLWFVVVAEDGLETEGSWGTASTGAQRNGSAASGLCGWIVRNNSASCPWRLRKAAPRKKRS